MILVNHKPQRVRFILDTGPEAAATSSILRSGNTHITKSILQGSMGYQDTILIFQVVLTAGLGSRPGHLMALERQREREKERERMLSSTLPSSVCLKKIRNGFRIATTHPAETCFINPAEFQSMADLI